MKAFLMYRDRDFDLRAALPSNEGALTQDLELDVLFNGMAAGDAFLLDIARKAFLTSLENPEAITYRQHVLADCLERSAIVREMYAIAAEAVAREQRIWGWTILGRYPDSTLHRSVDVLELFVGLLKRLRHIVDEHGATFRSEGFRTLLDMLAKELNDEYLSIVEDHLRRLTFRSGLLMSAELGLGNKGTQYVLRKLGNSNQGMEREGWMARLQNWIEPSLPKGRYTYQIADRDEAGFRALSELKGRGISLVASALAQSTDHILSFFSMLRLELGFYIGCLNLRDRLSEKGEPICFPDAVASGSATLSGRGLYDVCLSLGIEERVVGNDVHADGKVLVIITGANRGGKSTCLRSVGLAQLMMQCGMFVSGESFRANLCTRIFTHFKREEDAGMRSGKLDEELRRMSAIVDDLTPNSLVLLNESFASTNEREGSEIARQIVRALLERRIRVVYVTHMFDLARGFYLANMPTALFLRAERLADGQRTFRLVEAEPQPTSYGEDLYRRIFGAVPEAASRHANDIAITPGARDSDGRGLGTSETDGGAADRQADSTRPIARRGV